MKKYLATLFLMVPFFLMAQSSGDWFEETMYSSGKIYVVVTVVAVILVGIFAYLIWLDQRLRRMEEENTND